MDDKRIKLITKEMFIAWGLICIGFIVIDNIWHVFEISPMYTCHPAYTGTGAVAKAIIFYSNLLTIFISSVFIGLIKFLAVKTEPALAMTLLDVMVIIIQFVIYWYLGNLFGRLIVWIKHFRKKSKPQPEN
jgi:hypothetical protein